MNTLNSPIALCHYKALSKGNPINRLTTLFLGTNTKAAPNIKVANPPEPSSSPLVAIAPTTITINNTMNITTLPIARPNIGRCNLSNMFHLAS